MFRLFRLYLRLALKSTETLFGLGIELYCGIFSALLCKIGYFNITNLVFAIFPPAVFIPFALSLDNENGTIRNKFIAGYSRLQYYLSEMLTALTLGLIYFVIGFVPFAIVCRTDLARLKGEELARLLLMMISSFAIIGVVGAVICCLVHFRTAAIFTAVFVFIGASFVCTQLSMKLSEREYVYTEGFTVTPNDDYIGGPGRYVMRFITYSSPYPQYMLAEEVIGGRFETNKRDSLESAARHSGTMYEKEALSEYDRYCEQEDDLALIPLYTLGMTLLISSAGYLIFRKKNLQ